MEQSNFKDSYFVGTTNDARFFREDDLNKFFKSSIIEKISLWFIREKHFDDSVEGMRITYKELKGTKYIIKIEKITPSRSLGT